MVVANPTNMCHVLSGVCTYGMDHMDHMVVANPTNMCLVLSGVCTLWNG